MPVRLTDAFIRSLGSPGKRINIADSVKPGLLLRVTPQGVKSFAVWYRVHGRARLLTLGRYPKPTSLAHARQRAGTITRAAKDGHDAQTEKVEAREALKRDAERGTFEQLAGSFLDRNRERLRPRTHHEWSRIAKREILPRLGAKHPEEITRADVRSVVREIADRAPVMGNRTLELIRRIFSWAVSEDLVVGSPCVGLDKPSEEKRRDRVYRPDEIRALFDALPGTELEHLVPLIFYTAARSHESRSARWVDTDVESRLWTIPGETSKNAEAHPMPLSSQAMVIVRRIREGGDSDEWLFPASTKAGYSDHPQKAVERLREASGVSDFRLHDVRRTTATGLAALGTPDHIVEAVLGHTPPGLKQTYNRYQPIREMRTALEAWGRKLESIVSGEEPDTSVVPFSRA